MSFFLNETNKRSCGECTKCCEGFLTGTIRGKLMGEITDSIHNPKPCFFVEKGVGCKEYSKRPKNPCKTFECEWLRNSDIPENFKPNISNTITTRKSTISGLPYIYVLDAGKEMSSEILSWHILYSISNNINLAWKINGRMSWIGDSKFCEDMQKGLNINY